MDLLRKILFPLAVLYGWVTWVRNFLFDKGVLKSHSFDVPLIAVGNLSVGGTGKSPMIEYLIRLLSDNYRIATLSRGYKRSTTGFIVADQSATAASLGDEPMQFYQKFPELLVAVDANRVNGIRKLLRHQPKPDIILLDDAFQHRKVKAGFYILLTACGDLYADDLMLPTGNLRESASGAIRANVIVVTKCPPDLTATEQQKIIKKLHPASHQSVFFTSIGYDAHVYNSNGPLAVAEIRTSPKLLLAGIAKPEPFFQHLQASGDTIKRFADHHDFSEKEIAEIIHQANGRKIITTEKDYVRLKGLVKPEQLYNMPIKTVFLNSGDKFNQILKNYVAASTANR